MSALWKFVRQTYDDVLVFLFTMAGVFVNGIMPELLAVQRGMKDTLPHISPSRIIVSAIIAAVVMMLESVKNGNGEAARSGRQKPQNLATRIVLAFSLGYTLTGLMKM